MSQTIFLLCGVAVLGLLVVVLLTGILLQFN